MPSPTPEMTDFDSDERLIDRARSGEQLAFRLLIAKHEGIVASTVIGLLGRGVDADEVGQETFVRCFRSLEQFRGESALATYLVTIARNLSLTALAKRSKARARFVDVDSDSTGTLQAPVEPFDLSDTNERQTMVERALARLSEAHRSVVVLRLMQGLSTKETAAALSVPEGTVLSRLARASAQLKSLLAPYIHHGAAVEGA